MSNNVKYKNTHPVWTALGIIFLVLILCAGVTALVGWLGFGWFTNDTEDEVIEDDLETGSRDGDDIQSGIVLSTYAIDPDDYEEYGVNPLAESAYTLKATIQGDNIYDIRVDWKLYWDESYTGNDDVNEYVTLNDYSNASQEVILTCLQPFGYNIYVEAYRTAYPDTCAVCKLDYVAKGSSTVSAEFNEEDLTIDLIHTDDIGVGTIKGTFDFSTYYFSADTTTLAGLDDLLNAAFPYSEITYWSCAVATSAGTEVEPVSFDEFLDNFTHSRGGSNLSESFSYRSSSLVYSDFIFSLADALSYSTNSTNSWSTYIKIDGSSIASTDLVDVLWAGDWNFYINGLISYTTAVSSVSYSFDTDCTFYGSLVDILMDDATLTLDQENIIFGI